MTWAYIIRGTTYDGKPVAERRLEVDDRTYELAAGGIAETERREFTWQCEQSGITPDRVAFGWQELPRQSTQPTDDAGGAESGAA